MKKRLITILSLVMAFVLCFSLVACGGDKGGNGGGTDKKDPPQSDNTVSISVNDALDAVNGVLTAQGFTGTASYSLSTKNTEKLTESVTLDKRGTKLKLTAGEEETIVDYQTGYVYFNGQNGYTYNHVFYANAFDYAQYLIASLKKQVPADQKIEARYDAETKTITFTVEKADSVNKYVAPLQNAYKKDKTVGDLLNEYCKLLFGKTFDAMYSSFEKYVKNPKNTVGTLLAELKANGLDVEALLEMFGYTLPEQQMTAIKARPLYKVVAGAYNFIMQNFGSLIPLDEDSDDDISDVEGGGMESFGMGLLNAMLYAEVSDNDIAAGLQGLSGMVTTVKNTFTVKSIVEMLKTNAKTADLYTVIKEGVKLTNANITFTLTVDDNKVIKGVNVDCYAAHNYNGEAAEGSFLADNDYRATAELVIDEYKTSTEDFVITCDPNYGFRASIISLLYEVTDKDVSIYLETGGKTGYVTVEQGLSVETLDGEVVRLDNVPEGAFKFDEATSSFVFDGDVVKSALENADFGTTLFALVYFDGDENDLCAIGLAYVNDDWQAIYDYVYTTAMENIMDFIGGASSDGPNIGEITSIDGTYYFMTDEGELDENYYFEIEDGYIVTFIENGNDMSENVILMIDGNEVVIAIAYPETEQESAYGIALCGDVYKDYIKVTEQINFDENGEVTDTIECNLYWYKSGAQPNA